MRCTSVGPQVFAQCTDSVIAGTGFPNAVSLPPIGPIGDDGNMRRQAAYNFKKHGRSIFYFVGPVSSA
jgi:hypothetical protein